MSGIKLLFGFIRLLSLLIGIDLRNSYSMILRNACFLNSIFLLGSYCSILPEPAQATTIVNSRFDQICDAAAQRAAEETGVPVDVLMAISRTETGIAKSGTMQPWPWTVNMKGRGVWFDTKSEALTYVFDHFKTGARSFDVGCFQINYRWHGAHFVSIEEMLDPLSNALYAALFLRKLYAENGDWTIAAGAFHSRNQIHADRYMARFESMLAELDLQKFERSTTRASSIIENQENRFPLLQMRQATGLASLVPLPNFVDVKPVIDLAVDEGS